MTLESGRVRWRKSSRSGGTNGNCIELAHTLNQVRDSKNPTGPTMTVDVPSLLDTIKADLL